jgi:hypothetical protein
MPAPGNFVASVITPGNCLLKSRSRVSVEELEVYKVRFPSKAKYLSPSSSGFGMLEAEPGKHRDQLAGAATVTPLALALGRR